MATEGVEQLSPLDLIMPRLYTCVVLAFRTAQAPARVKQDLQKALDTTVTELPWLAGRVYPSKSLPGAGAEIRWDTDDAPLKIADAGSVVEAYETMAKDGMNPVGIPISKWPLMGPIDEATQAAGVAVFGASLFRFADSKGVGVCVSIHHHVADGAGLAEVLRVWARNAENTGLNMVVMDRSKQLQHALSSDLSAASSTPVEDLLRAHSEYTLAPMAFPSEFPECTSKVFSIPLARIDEIKERLQQPTMVKPTSNTVLVTMLWSLITRARMQRDPKLADKGTSRLGMAVNGRKRIAPTFSTPEHPYFGNIVLYALAEMAFDEMNVSGQTTDGMLAKICDTISHSVSTSVIDREHVAGVNALANKALETGDTLNMSWEAFGSRDLTITSWADLGLHGLDFGKNLGRPEFVRLPHFSMAADGVCIVLPRKRGVPGETLEVVIMLRKDDMQVLEGFIAWKSLLQRDNILQYLN